MSKTVLRVGVIVIIAGLIWGCNLPGRQASVSGVPDVGGVWQGTFTMSSQTGACPPMPAQSGPIEIEQDGEAFTLMFVSGYDCDPWEACVFSGTISDGDMAAANQGVADNEGGEYMTTMTLLIESDKIMHGFGTSTYTHPEMQCTWETELLLMRE